MSSFTALSVADKHNPVPNIHLFSSVFIISDLGSELPTLSASRREWFCLCLTPQGRLGARWTEGMWTGEWGKWEVGEVLPPVLRRGSRTEVRKERTGAQPSGESTVDKDILRSGCSIG